MQDRSILPHSPHPQIAATIGLISDTHMPQRCEALPAAVFDIFDGVDLILHAGDVGELWVLDQLSRIAPVIAVHGNDDTVDAQRELPVQQVVTIAGQRILLWHSHFADRIDELDSRRSEPLQPKFWRMVERAKRCGAQTVVFGHWHIPLLYEADGIKVVNPGAIAPGNAIMRQLRQTVALLFICADGTVELSHVDLANPSEIYQPQIDFTLDFGEVAKKFSASILAPELIGREGELFRTLHAIDFEDALSVLLRVAHRCWRGDQESITLGDLLKEVALDTELSASKKARLKAELEQMGLPRK